MRYPKEIGDFIRDNVQGRSVKILTQMINDKFGTAYSEDQIHNYKKNHHLCSGTVCGSPKGISTKFPQELFSYLRENAHGKSRKELLEMVNRDLNLNMTLDQLISFLKNHHITTGVDARFKKGQECMNRLAKGTYYPGCEKTWFKKGHTPHNTLPVGTVVKTEDGYLLQKVSATGTQWERWKFVHQLVWERHNGPIPDGGMVIFLDGNRENVAIENLELIDNSIHAQMITRNLRFSDPDVTRVGVTLAKLASKTSKRKKKR